MRLILRDSQSNIHTGYAPLQAGSPRGSGRGRGRGSPTGGRGKCDDFTWADGLLTWIKSGSGVRNLDLESESGSGVRNQHRNRAEVWKCRQTQRT